MAPTLSSNSFLLNVAPHPRFTLKKRRLTVFAKKAGPFTGFRLGKSAGDEDGQEETTTNSSPFRFDFGKMPDVTSLVPVVTRASGGGVSSRRKDPGTVFVAGAIGQVGIRISHTLLREGFRVRAGVSDLGAAQELARLAASYKIISNEESRRLNAVESNFQDAESIAKAIGNASKVVVTIGAGEDGPASEVTALDALQVIQGAQLANVGHLAIIYNGSSLTESTYNVLDGLTSFFNNLFSITQEVTIPELLQKLAGTDLSYTLIKTNLTEDFSPESSYNIVVSAEGSTGADDYKVAKSQIASLVADVFSNTAMAENKVVEVFTDPSAPSKSIGELFSVIPVDGRREAYADALAKAKAEEEAQLAKEKAREAAEAAKKLEVEVKKLEEQEALASSLAAAAEEKTVAAGTSFDNLLNKAKGISSGMSWENLSTQLKSAVQNPTEMPKVQVATVRGQAKARSLPAQKALLKKPTLKSLMPTPKEVKKPTAKSPVQKPNEVPKPETQSDSKKEVRKFFGGLFQQETIYVDDD